MNANALRPGDAIGIVAPASPPRSEERLQKSAAYFERLGYRVVTGKHVTPIASLPTPSYLAASDAERAADLHDMFANPNIKAIFFHRGGFGCIRLLDRLDYDLIGRNPKIIVGYSDATALFAALHSRAGLTSCFMGPMPGVDLWETIDPFTEDHLWRTLTSTGPIGGLPGIPSDAVWGASPDAAIRARWTGGNLTVACSLMGTPYQPAFDGAIPLLEEIDEKPRKVDALLAQLRLAGWFDRAPAVLLGQFTGCLDNAPTRPLDAVLHDYFGDLRVPVIASLPFGHEPRMWTLPYGAMLDIVIKDGRAAISIPETVLD